MMAVYDFSEINTADLDRMLHHLQEAEKCGFEVCRDALFEIKSELKKRVITEGNK